MPAQKKPPERRQRRNKTDVGLVLVDGTGPAHPPADKGWLVATKQRWQSYWGSPVARVVDTTSDMPALRRLFELYDQAERAQRSLRKQPFVDGSQGQPVLNPMAGFQKSLEGAIRQLEDRFGLTPLARLKLGVTFGAAASSLEELTADFDADDPQDEDDPRLALIEGDAKPAKAKRRRRAST